jgi:hypothetical protein
MLGYVLEQVRDATSRNGLYPLVAQRGGMGAQVARCLLKGAGALLNFGEP